MEETLYHYDINIRSAYYLSYWSRDFSSSSIIGGHPFVCGNVIQCSNIPKASPVSWNHSQRVSDDIWLKSVQGSVSFTASSVSLNRFYRIIMFYDRMYGRSFPSDSNELLEYKNYGTSLVTRLRNPHFMEKYVVLQNNVFSLGPSTRECNSCVINFYKSINIRQQYAGYPEYQWPMDPEDILGGCLYVAILTDKDESSATDQTLYEGYIRVGYSNSEDKHVSHSSSFDIVYGK